MDQDRVGFNREEIENSINPMRADYSRNLIELSMHPMKSNYQESLEEKGWEFITNVNAVNGLMDYTEDRKTLRYLIEDCKKLYPGKKVKLTRAYNTYGERIPSKEKTIAVYTRDR